MPKISVGDSFTVALISGMEKVRMREGEYQEFPSKSFVSQGRTISIVGIPSVFHYFQASKSFMLQRVMSRFSIFCRNFFLSHSAE